MIIVMTVSVQGFSKRHKVVKQIEGSPGTFTLAVKEPRLGERMKNSVEKLITDSGE